jgi:hypothetical protein
LDNNSLTSLVIPPELTQLSYIYANDNLLTSFDIPSQLTLLRSISMGNNNLLSITIPSEATSLENISLSESNSIIVNNTSDFNDYGQAMLYDNTSNKYEIIIYASKNNTLINTTRGIDQSIGLTFAINDKFAGIINRNTNIELVNNIL